MDIFVNSDSNSCNQKDHQNQQIWTFTPNEHITGDILIFNSNDSNDNLDTGLNIKTQEGNVVKVQSQVYKNTRFIVLSDSEGLVLSEEQLEEVIAKVKPQTNQVIVQQLPTEEISLG